MSSRFNISKGLFLLALSLSGITVFGQQGMSLSIKKPKEFENRTLRSEKSDQKKLSGTGKFIQNTVTHYNYYYNANIRLNDILDRAKSVFKDDYSQLIPFYNYSLDVTATDSLYLDSLSYKAQTAIVLHDLRTDWADNMYLIWGTTYYLRKQFDSAHLMFQFINYAFAEKEDDGYYKVIGSARDGNNTFNISTKEKNNLTSRMFKKPPSRNDAFVWQIRNYIAMERFSEASSLIQALKRDSTFPKRLHNDLEEMQAYFFYKQNMWDSAAAHLELALSNAGTKQEKARWEYLLGQLYESVGQYKDSEKWYVQSIGHTIDPVMDIYARLASIRVNKDGGENYIEKNIGTLLKMAKRDKYQDYRDIIYYMAAQMELERNNIDGALALLNKSVQYEAADPAQRNRTFLQMAELSFSKKLYRQSANFYDSIRLDDPTLKDIATINSRKALLSRLADNIEVLERQDSLRALAALPENLREDKVRKLVKQLRKQKGLKDESATMTTGSSFTPQTAPNLFDSNKKGEWYFYNASTRQKGASDFKSKWGNRPNADNWRRSAAISNAVPVRPDQTLQPQIKTGKDIFSASEQEITFGALYDRIPLTEAKMKVSNDSTQNALFALGVLYVKELEDCEAGTSTLEQLRAQFQSFPKMDEVLYNLYFCYHRNGLNAKATEIKQALAVQYPTSNFTTIVTTGKNPKSTGPDAAATSTYEKIYDLFIEGKFQDAIAMKKEADIKYGRNYWTPQLSYIEAVYYIKQREDSIAKNLLATMILQYNKTPIADKAKTLLDVLNRRAQIEEELRNLVVVRPAEDSVVAVQHDPVVPEQKPIVTPTKTDTVSTQPTVVPPPIAPVPKTTIDTIAKVVAPPVAGFSYNADAPHFVVIILNKVDPVFVNEAKNAFYRYNRDTYYNKQMQTELVEIDNENRLLLISPFRNAAEAIAYVDQTKPKTSTEIVPWLKGGKYTYSIITEKNLDVLKITKDIDKYTDFLQKSVPGKF